MAIVVPAQPDGERLAARLVELPLTDARWRALVAETATLPFHLPEWAELVGDCYGFRAFGLGLAEADGSLVAGLPVVEASLPFGRRRRWVSQPYTDYCPPLAPGDEEAARLVDAVDAARADADIGSVELRAEAPGRPFDPQGYRHVLELEPDAAAVRARFKKKQVTQRIGKA